MPTYYYYHVIIKISNDCKLKNKTSGGMYGLKYTRSLLRHVIDNRGKILTMITDLSQS